MSAAGAPVGLVPAAGYARRLQPLAGSKEMCKIGGRPVMDFLLDRMEAASCTEIRVVTRPDKPDVAAHARARGATVILARPESVSASLLAGLDGVPRESPVVFGFPDTLWEPVDGFARLLAALRPGADVALGIFRAEAPSCSDVVTLDAGRVSAIHVKPDEPPSTLVWGCAATIARVLAGVRGYKEPGHFFDRLAREGVVRGVRLEDPFVDIGTPNSLRRARARFSGEAVE